MGIRIFKSRKKNKRSLDVVEQIETFKYMLRAPLHIILERKIKVYHVICRVVVVLLCLYFVLVCFLKSTPTKYMYRYNLKRRRPNYLYNTLMHATNN